MAAELPRHFIEAGLRRRSQAFSEVARVIAQAASRPGNESSFGSAGNARRTDERALPYPGASRNCVRQGVGWALERYCCLIASSRRSWDHHAGVATHRRHRHDGI